MFVSNSEPPRPPGLIQMAWRIRSKGILEFFMDQWRAQGDLAQLKMGRHEVLFAVHPDHVRQICLGSSFAMLEAHVLSALLARRFAARLVTGHRPQIEMGGTLMVRNGLPMRLERREGSRFDEAGGGAGRAQKES